jgi:hypothetical protein
VAWQYAAGAWATYIPRNLTGSESRQDALRIAAAVTPQAARPLRTPYHLGYVPAGWQVVAATDTPARISSSISEVYLHQGPLVSAAKVDISVPSVRILVMRGQPKDETIRGKDGVHCYSPQAACTVIVGDYLIDVDGRFAPGLTDTDIRQIVLGLTPVSFTDRNAWVPVES